VSYVLSVIHPPEAPAAYGKAEVFEPVAVRIMGYGRVLRIAASYGLLPTHEASDMLTEVLSSMRPGEEWVHDPTGLTFRIDPADNAPHPCPCGEDEDNPCGRLVLPTDHAYADQDDAYCGGCFTWNRGAVACLPANTAHTEEPTTISDERWEKLLDRVEDQLDADENTAQTEES
jgi:hypothetical protein